MTAGLNYRGTNFVYEINPLNGKYQLNYNLLDSYAVEGIALYKGICILQMMDCITMQKYQKIR